MPWLLALLLLASVIVAGCREPEVWYELGQPFAAVPPQPDQARVYVYWPPASPSPSGAYNLVGQSAYAQLLPGGYVADAAAPGMIPFKIERFWHMGAADSFSSVGMHGPELVLAARAGQVYYLKVVPRPGLVDELALEAVPAAVGEREVRSCRLLRSKLGA